MTSTRDGDSPQITVPPTEAVPAAGPPWWRRNLTLLIPWALVVVLAAVVLWLLLPTGDGTSSPDTAGTRAVTVNFVLTDPDTAFLGCVGTGGYGDIGPGTPVTVRNGSGDVLGAASLGTGTASRTGAQMDTCTWSVQVPGVPAEESFYSVEVGSRGAITKSQADMQASDFIFDVSLGG